MNALISKEARLLLPSFLAALAIIPVWLQPKGYWFDSSSFTIYPFCLAISLVALASFGREFSLATFPLQMAQPFERLRLWRVKTGVLATAVICLLGGWWLSLVAWMFLGGAPGDTMETLVLGLPLALAIAAGGLWSTLLFRQVTAAFWFTVFIPAGITIGILAVGASGIWIGVALVLYAIGSFALARWLFRRAQEVMWTGGAVALNLESGQSVPSASTRSHHPVATLFTNELQLQQITLLGIISLFLLHLCVVCVRKMAVFHVFGPAREILDFFPFIWLFVPLLAGSLSIAEERRLGTMEAHLNLPVPGRIRYLVKFLVAILLGGFASMILLNVAEWLALAIQAPAQIGIWDPQKSLLVLSISLLALSVIAFYASSLAHNLLQALGVSVVLALLGLTLFRTGPYMDEILGVTIWRGRVFHMVTWPVLILTILMLARANYRRLAGDGGLWRRNILSLGGAMAVVLLATTAVYNRAWELVTPLEPPHGPAQFSQAKPPVLEGPLGGTTLLTLLPDGTMRVCGLAYDKYHQVKDGTRVLGEWLWTGSHLAEGSNWVQGVALRREVVAIRADGTLWVSERSAWRSTPFDRPEVEVLGKLVRFGNETNWKTIVKSDYDGVLLLKQDGSLWRWGQKNYLDVKNGGLRAYQPVRLGDTLWQRTATSGHAIYAWNDKGEAWVLYGSNQTLTKRQVQLENGLVMERDSRFDNTRWLSLASTMSGEVGVREDGTLWSWRLAYQSAPNASDPLPAPIQLGHENGWTAVSSSWDSLAALKRDGSLWFWQANRRDINSIFAKPPMRIGTHSDWVAIETLFDGQVAIAADGGLWCWELAHPWDERLLAPTRKPVLLENLLLSSRQN